MAKEAKLKPAKEPKERKPRAEKEEKKEKEVEPRLTDTGAEVGDLPVEGKPEPGEPVDYLRPYQYRKQTEAGSVESDPAPGSKAATMKAFLLSQPRVRMLIPRPQGEKSSIKQSVNLNGYRLDLPKDTYVEVPLQIAEVLGESLKQTNAALQVNRIDGDTAKERALL